MSGSAHLKFDALNAALKAAGEETRLRILVLLAEAELTVSDLTQILRQSQPRISRHLKLLVEAGLVERFREGAWAFFRLAEGGGARRVRARRWSRGSIPRISMIARDRDRLAAVRTARAAAAQDYFRSHAAQWDRIRKLHVTDEAVEGAIRDALAERPFRSLLDLGTGTGRILEMFGPGPRARPRHRPVARHAAARPRPASSARACAIAACARATSTISRCRRAPSTSSSSIRCCTSSTTARARSARRRACWRPAAGCWWSTSRRTIWNSCARSTPTAAWDLPPRP